MNSKNYVLLLCLILFFVSATGCSTMNGNGPENTPTPLVKTYPNWRQVSSDIQPNPRHQYGLAYDCHRNVIVMYGGRGWVGPYPGTLKIFDDTWEYSQEVGWSQIETVHNPSNLDHVTMVYDTNRKKTILFGGLIINQEAGYDYCSDETWEYDGTDWTKREMNVKPPERASHCMAYDSSSHLVIVVGGSYYSDEGGTEYRDDTWLYDGHVWTEVNSDHRPTRRHRAQMVYDSKRGVAILYGGDYVSGESPDDVHWEFDGEDWTRIETEHKPGRRARFGFTFHEGIGRAVFFGGDERGGRRQDTWEYDGRDWTRIPTETRPGPRTTVMVYNSDRQECFIFSGWDDNLDGYNDQWIYKYFE